jgi:hypothetical protein
MNETRPRTLSTHHVRETYDDFDNCSPHPITLAGQGWPTAEHYFQAQKFTDSAQAEAIRRAASPLDAARLGQSREHPLRADWETVKEDVMRAALHAKFTQHPALAARLLATGEVQLVNHAPNDRYWGDGGNGSGQNRLGLLLVELRTSLRSQ